MRPHRARRLLAALLACASTAALAEPIGYVSGFDTLYRVDLATGDSTRVGSAGALGFIDVEALTFHPDGTLYGVSDGGRVFGGNVSASTDFLFRVGLTSGVGSLVAQLPGLQGQGVGQFDALDYGMGFGCDGRLWLASATTQQFWQVDPGSAAVTSVGNLGVSISGLAGRGLTLFGVSIGTEPGLYRINVDTATATLIGPLNIGGTVSAVGLGFDDSGRLWATLRGLVDGNLNPTRVVRIDTVTGAATLVSAINLQNQTDAKALAIGSGGCAVTADPLPVPGPGMPGLLFLMMTTMGVAAIRLMRR